MQIIRIEPSHPHFFCPVTGVRIMDEYSFNYEAPSLMGYWLDYNWQNPIIRSNRLREAWEKYLSNGGLNSLRNGNINISPYLPLEVFFEQLEIRNAKVFQVANYNRFFEDGIPYIVLDFDWKFDDKRRNKNW